MAVQAVSAWIGANTSQCLRGTALSISFPWKDENFRFDLAGTIPATMKIFDATFSRSRESGGLCFGSHRMPRHECRRA